MPRNNSNKFYKSTGRGGKQPFKNFPIKKFIFEANHPIHNSSAKCSYRISSMWSQQEELMVKGLSNRLQCEAREAIRIAIYEACKVEADKLQSLLEFASATSKNQGHTSRDRKGSVSLPKEEKEDFLNLIKKLSITEKVGLRLCVIWLEQGINDESITKITNCKLIDPLKIRQQWSQENPHKPSTIQPLIDAQKKALSELDNIKHIEAKRREHYHQRTLDFLSENPGLTYSVARKLIYEEDKDALEQIIQEEADKQGLSSTQAEVFRYMSMGLTAEEAEAAVEKEEPLSDEEQELLDRELEEMLDDLKRIGQSAPNQKPLKLSFGSRRKRRKPPEFRPGEHKELINKLTDEIEKLEDRIEKGETLKEQGLKDIKNRLRRELSNYALTTYWEELYPDTV